ncbi:RHS repeat-associated core domain-containing protein [Sinomicrobium kalidii]|uniref:RHS repeat domain-containing protein n=1 Tax=Sinomicrobium kalidii TaxID=2900738 RepID=UPI001E37E9F9|nr:RHS repeat-associated core domain-containing protein [Sinomicrobium kalidii]UGU18156.1 RHS repeat-associated core domain-containing protein [Sinomicrobium kalidii]
MQTIDYTYNVRGWLKAINNPDAALGEQLFAFGIRYNDPAYNPTDRALYNGNISETYWRTANDDRRRNYRYTYDALNRITGATNTGAGEYTRYELKNVAYDKNGNITDLTRNGWQNSSNYDNMDVLDYRYNSTNKLLKVIDTGNKSYGFKDGTNTNNDYTYDTNGNLESDTNKGITGITYNHLNLPTRISFGANRIDYIYDASGIKLKKAVTQGSSVTNTEYAGNYIYENGALAFFSHSEGYVTKENNVFKYVYQYKDHLGNVRLSYANTGTSSVPQLEIIEENNYYPFGLEHRGYNNVINGPEYPYDYQGKENQKELGLNWHDFGARNYDAALGRWMTVDPMADERDWMTPYNFVQNSPLYRIDPDGLTDFKLDRKTGEITQVGEANDDPDRIVKTDKEGNVKKKGEGFLGFLVKKSERGKAKVAIGDIEKGILKDGQNFKMEDNVIDVGGEGQPTLERVKEFTLKLSNYIDKEIGGYFLSGKQENNISHVYLSRYVNNTAQEARSPFLLHSVRPDLFNKVKTRTHFHTHLSRFRDSDRLRPSEADRNFKKGQKSLIEKFILLTNPEPVEY